MKANGYNAIRTSHNPPSTAFLDACDRLGMLVLDEAFDCWERSKNPDDYGKYFKDWWQRDLDSMILRDRNHPCVILWSIGNEINERADERGYVIAKQLSDEVRRLDPTRPVTEAICGFWDRPGRHGRTPRRHLPSSMSAATTTRSGNTRRTTRNSPTASSSAPNRIPETLRVSGAPWRGIRT